MSPMDDLELAVAEWLTDEAAFHLPDHLGEVVTATAATRQRPAWSSLGRWLPMDQVTTPRYLLPARTGRLLLVALLALAIVGLALAAIGSRQRRFPPPYGPARNGELLASADGDIYRLDPVTYQRTPLITGDTFDFGPSFSRDGSRFTFLRTAPTDCGKSDCGLYLMVANADGSGVRRLTPGLAALDWTDWSPDGSRIVIDSLAPDGFGHVIDVVSLDGSAMRTLDVGWPVHEPFWLPPDGNEIVFRLDQRTARSDPAAGIFAIRPDGTGLRKLSTRPPVDLNDYEEISASPDGTKLGYRGDDGPEGMARAHILDLTTGDDRVLPGPDGFSQHGPAFSPDGRHVSYARDYPGPASQLVIAPLDGSNIGIEIGPLAPFGPDGPSINNGGFTPDGTAVYANYDTEQLARVLPIDGSPGAVLIHGQLAFPGYQRLAP